MQGAGGAPQFLWHPKARLFDPDGAQVHPVSGGQGAPLLLADRPAGAALARALAAAGAGFALRETAEGPAPETLPESLPVPSFETLTSGSSGAPRRILRPQASWTASFAVNARLFGTGPGVRLAVCGALRSSLALYGALEGLHLGADVFLMDGLRPDRQLALLAEARIRQLYATPAQLRLLCRDRVLPDLRLILCGGAKLDAQLRADLTRLAPAAALHEFYGAAETSFVTLADDTTPPHSVGRPYPGVRLQIRQGQVWVQSPYLFARYAGETPDPGGAEWQDGWLSVGEMGVMEQGNLVLLGRRGRMVTVADQNVFPESIEALMQSMPGILRAAVLPRPDAARGHVLMAFALAVDRSAPPAGDGILADLRAALGPLKCPRSITWLDHWPELASGKTDLQALARLLA